MHIDSPVIDKYWKVWNSIVRKCRCFPQESNNWLTRTILRLDSRFLNESELKKFRMTIEKALNEHSLIHEQEKGPQNWKANSFRGLFANTNT
ncbi:hypothetical protein RB195_005262 [Necator americanus]|uniref:Uncharacterized protein n=1 Tax=Necator americanus TaxID=51031 RepID=A0ABR1BQ78_NECAM